MFASAPRLSKTGTQGRLLILLRDFPNSGKVNPLKYFSFRGTFKSFILQENSQENANHYKICQRLFFSPSLFSFSFLFLFERLGSRARHPFLLARENCSSLRCLHSNQEIELFLIFITFFFHASLTIFLSETTSDFTSANLPLFSLELQLKNCSSKKFDPIQIGIAKIPSVLQY